jgi:hypothetical protein
MHVRTYHYRVCFNRNYARIDVEVTWNKIIINDKYRGRMHRVYWKN